MPVWERIRDGGLDHYADIPLVQAWAANAMALSSEENERILTEGPVEDQKLSVERAMGAVGMAYRSANIRPTTDSRYAGIWRHMMGPGVAVDGGQVAASDPAQLAGVLTQQAVSVFEAVSGGPRPPYKVNTRVWLLPDGLYRTACLTPGDMDGCNIFDASDPSAGRARPGGAPCSDPWDDWQCVLWNSTTSGTRILMPSQWTLPIVRMLVQPILADPRGWVIATMLGGASAITTGQPPDAQSQDIPSVRRPAPSTMPVPVPVPVPVPRPGASPTSTSAPQALSGSDAATFGPILLAAGLIGVVLLGQSARPARASRRR